MHLVELGEPLQDERALLARATRQRACKQQVAILYRWSYCTGGHIAQVAILHSPPVSVPAGSSTSPSSVTDRALTFLSNAHERAAAMSLHTSVVPNTYLPPARVRACVRQARVGKGALHGSVELVVVAHQREGEVGTRLCARACAHVPRTCTRGRVPPSWPRLHARRGACAG